MPRRRRAEPDDPPSHGASLERSPPPVLTEILLDAIGLTVPLGNGPDATTLPANMAMDAGQAPAPSVHELPLNPPSTIEDPELRRLCARAVLEARCGRLWFARRSVALAGARGWLESVVLGEDGRPLERGAAAVRLPWQEARRHEHAAVLTDMAVQAPVRCLWRGRPDLAKGLKLGQAAAILAEIEHGPASQE